MDSVTFNSPHEVGSELWCEALSKHISEQVDTDTVAEYREPEPGRWHLGGSEVGHSCSRRIWYSFRWVLKQEFPPAQHRLFNRGHKEEDRFVHRLRRIGLQVWDLNPETGKQFRMEHKHEPHYGGSLDGMALLDLPIGPMWMLTEFKTHNDKSFTKLQKDGLRKSKPVHYAQMSSYGENYQFNLGLYCAVNKNNDELKWAVTPLDWKLGEMMTRKAIEIIRSEGPPRKLSQSEAHFECKFCPYRGPCHLGQPLLKNCRSCRHASPNLDNSEWSCSIFGNPIPRDLVVTGCPHWQPVA